MSIGSIIKKQISNSGDGKKIREITGANTFGDFLNIVLKKKPLKSLTAQNNSTLFNQIKNYSTMTENSVANRLSTNSRNFYTKK